MYKKHLGDNRLSSSHDDNKCKTVHIDFSFVINTTTSRDTSSISVKAGKRANSRRVKNLKSLNLKINNFGRKNNTSVEVRNDKVQS